MAFTAVFKKVPEGYIAFVEELAGANRQGATLEEARENRRAAVRLVLESNRELARREADTGEVIREPLKIADGDPKRSSFNARLYQRSSEARRGPDSCSALFGGEPRH